MKPNVKRYVISIAVGLALTLLLMIAKDFFSQDRKTEIFRILSDSFFAVGVLFSGVGVILFASDNGLFDMLSYGVKTFFTVRKRDVKNRKYKDYYEYKKAKSEKKRSKAYLLLVGLLWIIIAGVWLIGYYN